MMCCDFIYNCNTALICVFLFDNVITLELVAQLRNENIQLRGKLEETEEKLEVYQLLISKNKFSFLVPIVFLKYYCGGVIKISRKFTLSSRSYP